MDEKLEKRNARLSQINESMERKLRQLYRLVNAIDSLRKERKRLLAPRKLEPHETIKIESKDWHKIREQKFSDEIPDFLKRV